MIWDVVIVGGGPAAIQAAIAAASEGLKTVIIEKDKIGGQIGQTPLLENFVAAAGGITGPTFATAMKAQAERMGTVIQKGQVFDIGHNDAGNVWLDLRGDAGYRVYGHTCILAMGNSWQDLNIPGVKEGITARTVHYGPVECLSTDVAGLDVAVYGGGPSAGQAIIELANRGAKKVRVLMRSVLNMPQYLVDRINALPAVKLYEHTTIQKVAPVGNTLGLLITSDAKQKALAGVSHLFMCSGLVPATGWLPEKIKRDEHGRILVGPAAGAASFLHTSMKQVYAIGDCRSGSTPRVSAAIGDGAFVVTEIWKHFRENPVCSVCK
jgi:thioredoxin reductase (NADPH)